MQAIHVNSLLVLSPNAKLSFRLLVIGERTVGTSVLGS
jgi:hypothetical protein